MLLHMPILINLGFFESTKFKNENEDIVDEIEEKIRLKAEAKAKVKAAAAEALAQA